MAVALLAVNTGLVSAWDGLTFSATEEDHMITLTNQARASNGLKSLIEDATLRSVAEQRAKYIYDNSYPYHTQKDGQTAFTKLQALGYCYKVAGENLGYNNYCDSQTTQWQFDWFMNSSAHRANILGSSYDHIGVGAYKGSSSASAYYHVFVMVFAQKCSSSPTPTPKPSPTPTPLPTATPHATPKPTTKPTPTTAPNATPTPSDVASPTPELSPEPTPTLEALDPAEQHGALAWKFLASYDWTGAGTPSGSEPTVAPTPEATSDTSGTGSTDAGLAVVDEVPNLSLLDTIVGDVVAAYFGP